MASGCRGPSVRWPPGVDDSRVVGGGAGYETSDRQAEPSTNDGIAVAVDGERGDVEACPSW